MKILHLEDDPGDAALVRGLLAARWPDCALEVVATRENFLSALAQGGYDVVLSDFQLPGFDGHEALQLTLERAPGVPFLFFSSTPGEERAVAAIHAGAADCVGQDRPERLALAIERALRASVGRGIHRETEKTRAQEQNLLRMLLEHLPDHVYFKDLDSRFIAASDSLARRRGLTSDQIKGKTDFDLFSGVHARKAFADEQHIIRTGEPLLEIEEQETWPDGSVTWVSSTKLPLRDAAGNVVGTFGISRDVTARKLADDRIREQAEIIDRAPISITVTDVAGRITYCNAGAAALHGLSREEMLGRAPEELLTLETVERLKPAWAATRIKGQWDGEVPVVTRDGRRFQAEFHMTQIYDASGLLRGRLSIAVDATEKKQLEQQFLRAQRLESLGLLAAGIAHDLNNVLSPVLMAAPLLRTHSTSPTDLRILETIENSAGRGAALVRQILSFAQGAGGEQVLIQPKHLLREIAELANETFPKNIDLDIDVPGNLWTVLGNPTQLHQVMLNLCVNARDAMPVGGTLRLRAENRQIEPSASQSTPGAYLVVEVSDTGTGISPEDLERIWDPFFTTKSEGKGTGLGLATVRGIAAQHRGFVTVESAVGRGTTFRVFLPSTGPEAASGPRAATAHPFATRGQGELVLVVDDEASIRDLSAAILSRSGYRVLTAANGHEALGLFRSRAVEISLVVIDLFMPEMDGSELAAALAVENPEVRLLFMSGAERAMPAGKRLLDKPFTGDELLGRVHEALPVRGLRPAT